MINVHSSTFDALLRWFFGSLDYLQFENESA
jgi:hypothetical protein